MSHGLKKNVKHQEKKRKVPELSGKDSSFGPKEPPEKGKKRKKKRELVRQAGSVGGEPRPPFQEKEDSYKKGGRKHSHDKKSWRGVDSRIKRFCLSSPKKKERSSTPGREGGGKWALRKKRGKLTIVKCGVALYTEKRIAVKIKRKHF